PDPPEPPEPLLLEPERSLPQPAMKAKTRNRGSSNFIGESPRGCTADDTDGRQKGVAGATASDRFRCNATQIPPAAPSAAIHRDTAWRQRRLAALTRRGRHQRLEGGANGIGHRS